MEDMTIALMILTLRRQLLLILIILTITTIPRLPLSLHLMPRAHQCHNLLAGVHPQMLIAADTAPGQTLFLI
jgi:hypothetical protein